MLSDFIDSLLPPRCVITGDIVELPGMVSSEAWSGLDFITQPFCRCCGFPFAYHMEDDLLCTSCMNRRPSFGMSRSALRYNETSRSLILGFKHADKMHAVQAFIPWLQRAGAEMLAEADYLAPVPLHYWRMVSRRYNQSGLICTALGDASDITVCLDLLMRVRATPSQGHLTFKERYKNVRKAFAVREKYKSMIKGKHIVLVDDVYTTGATLKECSKALLRAGAGCVDCLTLARVVRDEFFS